MKGHLSPINALKYKTQTKSYNKKKTENGKDRGNTKLKAWQSDTTGILFHNLKSVCNVYVKIVDGCNTYKYKGLYMEYSHQSTCIRVRWSTASPGHSWNWRDPAQGLLFLRLWIGMGWGFFLYGTLSQIYGLFIQSSDYSNGNLVKRVNLKIKQILDMFVMPYSKGLSPQIWSTDFKRHLTYCSCF